MKTVDRALLVVAYVLLVGIVIFMAWDLQRTLHRNNQTVCRTTVVTLITSLVAAQPADVTKEDFDVELKALRALADSCDFELPKEYE